MLCAAGAAALACGPFFPNRMLVGGEYAVLAAPMASFRERVTQVPLQAEVPFKMILPPGGSEEEGYCSDPHAWQTFSGDLADLEQAMREQGAADGNWRPVLMQYRSLRRAFFGSRLYRSPRTYMWDEDREKAKKLDDLVMPEVPKGLPGEFEDYIRGAILLREGKRAEAREKWKALLQRPADERRYRSTWAAFMLAKTSEGEDNEEELRYYRRVRELAQQGFVDTLGLAAASYGAEARAMLDRCRQREAIHLYLAQAASGDPGAVVSLAWTASSVVKWDDDRLVGIAADPTARKLITAYLVSRRYCGWGRRMNARTAWLSALERANVTAADEALDLACVAYQTGDFELAKRWLKLAPYRAPIARWIRAKLLLREGKVREASNQLRYVVRAFPASEGSGPSTKYHRLDSWSCAGDPASSRAAGELGMLMLTRRQFSEALDALARGGYWVDASYVAERVLTARELQAYIDRTWPEPEGIEGESLSYWRLSPVEEKTLARRLRYLLARRMAREGRLALAAEYYPPEWREPFDTYVKSLRTGRDRNASREERAAALWKAACIMRYQGMELTGAEVSPDWTVYGGDFERVPTTSERLKKETEVPNKITPATAEERRRVSEHDVHPQKRFHYRYRAAELAWEAAGLMPDHTDETARVLCVAGMWLKDRDPQGADRFYKALVNRCRRVPLGEEADHLRWFPKIEIHEEKEFKREG